MAAMKNHRGVLSLLCDHGVDMECGCDLGKRPLHYAAQHGGNKQLTRWLIIKTVVPIL